MSVVDEPAAAVPVEQPAAPARPAHLARAAGIELLGHVDNSGFKSGAARGRRAGRPVVQLGTPQ